MNLAQTLQDNLDKDGDETDMVNCLDQEERAFSNKFSFGLQKTVSDAEYTVSSSPGHMLYFPNKIAFLSLKIVFDLANSADSYEMMHYAAFHLIVTVCLGKNSLRSLQFTKA